ncbi:Glycosyl transferase family 2 [Lachnospiraceae bacterium G11]|nr:Glycosyl transferase family 2 [Lachnospiraceae bacterium G11]
MSKVSICIPAYNNGTGVKRLLESIKNQTYKDYEVILTDDSTTDDVKKAVDESGVVVNYTKNETRDGSTANWNKAIDKASGEYIKIMHHDDWFTDSDSLARMVRLLDENPEAILAFSGTMQVGTEDTYSRHIKKEDAKLIREDWRNLYLGNTIGAPSSVIHRKTDKRYDTNLKWLVDSEFYLQLLEGNKPFAYTEEPLISIGVGDDQITNSCINDSEVNIREYKYVYNKHNLIGIDVYKDKLETILLSYDAMLSDLKETDISKISFTKKKLNKLCRKIRYKLHAV